MKNEIIRQDSVSHVSPEIVRDVSRAVSRIKARWQADRIAQAVVFDARKREQEEAALSFLRENRARVSYECGFGEPWRKLRVR